jgi:hypothetical protein
VLDELDRLRNDEKRALAMMLRDGYTTVPSDVTDRVAGSLVARGLLNRAAGTYDQLEWPHRIPNFVWKEMQRRKENILEWLPREARKPRLRPEHPWQQPRKRI